MKKVLLVVIVSCVGLGISWGGDGPKTLTQAWALANTMASAEKPLKKSYPEGQVKEIHLAIQRGKIRVIPSRGPIELDILRLDHVEHCDISTTLQNGALHVIAKTKGWLWGSGNLGDGIKIPYNEKSACSVAITISAPPDRFLSLAGSYANIFVTKWDGSVKLSMDHAQARLDGVEGSLSSDSVSSDIKGTLGSPKVEISSVSGSLHLAWSKVPYPDKVEISEVRSDSVLEFPKTAHVSLEKSGWATILNQFENNGRRNERGKMTQIQFSGVGGTLQIVKSAN